MREHAACCSCVTRIAHFNPLDGSTFLTSNHRRQKVATEGKSVAHLTSVHMRSDTRIFLKECQSLVAEGYQVSLVVADGEGDENSSGVQVCDVGYKPGRIRRMTDTSRRILARALALNANIYHLHDPELLTITGRLKRAGKVVIFDAHEDVSSQILGKPYVYPIFRQVLSKTYAAYETRTCRALDAVVTATPFIRDKFLRINSCTIDINNYPMLDELAAPAAGSKAKKSQVCYVGGIGVSRGIREMVQALRLVKGDIRLALCGRFEEQCVRSDLKVSAGWESVDDMGWLDRDDVRKVLHESAVGLVILHPLPNYLDALPVKMFEYMSASVPVIASDFPLWRNIIDRAGCGICVNPMDPHAIAAAIDSLIENPARAREMGENGRKAVQDIYNWSIEEQKLFRLYERICH